MITSKILTILLLVMTTFMVEECISLPTGGKPPLHTTKKVEEIPDDPNLPKQHVLLTRPGPKGTEVLMIGSQKSNEKGLGIIRGKAKVGEVMKLDTVQREMKEEPGYLMQHAKKIEGPFRGQKNKNTQGYIVHLPANAKPAVKGEDREAKWVHHSELSNHLSKRPEMKDLVSSMKGKLKEADERNAGKFPRSQSAPPRLRSQQEKKPAVQQTTKNTHPASTSNNNSQPGNKSRRTLNSHSSFRHYTRP